MNIFSYVRVSGLGQVDKDGPVRQREVIKDFCAKHSLTQTAEFFEEGVSGTVEGMDRPKFAEMLGKIALFKRASVAAAEQELPTPFLIEAVVVERMDRLARDLMVSEFLLRECRRAGIKVFCVDQGDLIDMASDSGDPTRKMLRQILGAIAEWDKSVTVKKLRAARTRIRKDGKRCEGKKAFGAKHGEKEIIAEIHHLRGVGGTFSEIANLLNKKHLKTRHGKDWTESGVYTVYTQRAVSPLNRRQYQ
jgi:DNA invertase Pin-like site-specific DNA recombinase